MHRGFTHSAISDSQRGSDPKIHRDGPSGSSSRAKIPVEKKKHRVRPYASEYLITKPQFPIFYV